MAFSCFSQLNGDRPQAIAVKRMVHVLNFTRGNSLASMFFSCPYSAYEHSFQSGITFCVILCFSCYLGMTLKAKTACFFIFRKTTSWQVVIIFVQWQTGFDLSVISIHGHIWCGMGNVQKVTSKQKTKI